MDMCFFRRITANSKKYAYNHTIRGKYAGYKWIPISVSEIIIFLGIMLKMSIQDLKLGGCDAYWAREHVIHAGSNYTIKLEGFSP